MKDRIPFIACNELLLRLFVCLKTGFSSNEIPFLTARKLDDNCKALEASLLLSGAQVSGVSENISSLQKTFSDFCFSRDWTLSSLSDNKIPT